MFNNFKVNNDLNQIVFDFHNKFHFFGSIFLGALFGFSTSYSIGVAYEFLDGLKPSYKTYKDKPYKVFPKIRNWIRENFFYSNEYSLQDLLVHDLAGSAIGHIIHLLLLGGYDVLF